MTGNMSYLTDYEEIDRVENLIDQRVKVIRYDNGTEFKNKEMIQFCERKGIKREFIVARTPQQNGVAERKNRTLIEAAKTMLADSKLPTTFWAEAVKADEGLFVGYSINSKAFRVFNSITRIVEENLHVYSKSSPYAEFKPSGDDEKKVTEEPRNEGGDSSKDDESNDQEKDDNVNINNNVNAASTNEVNVVGRKSSIELPDDLNMPELEDIVYSDDDEDVGTEVDMNNLDAFMPVSPIQSTRIHKDHPVEQIIEDLNSTPQTRRMTKNLEEHEPKKVWTLVDLPNGKRAIGTKWVYRNKKDERGIMIKNKARLVAQGYTQEEGIDYDKMDIKSAFLYGNIEEEFYICQPPGFEDPDSPDRVYKVEKALYGLHQAPRAWYETLLTYLLDNGCIIFGSTKKSLCTKFEKMMHKKLQMSSMGELTFCLGLQVKKKEDELFINQDKYVTEILKKFGFTDVKTANTPMETQKPLLKDEDDEEVDVHLYRSMIGSLMYLTSSRPDIMYLKGQPKLGLWYPKYLPFYLVAYIDSDYAGASLDRKSTIGGCQFLGCRLISWQCKKQTVVANSITEAEYVATSNLLTKAFDVSRFQYLVASIGMLIKVLIMKMNGIGVNGGDSKLMLLGINLLLLGKVNAARHKLTTVGETTVRRDLQLEDAEGIDCLPNADIFEQLTLMGQGKDFSGRVTPLFPTMVVQAQEEWSERFSNANDPHYNPNYQIFIISTSKETKSRRSKRKDTKVPQPSDPTNVVDEAVNEEPSMQLKELMDFCTKFQQRVLDLENTKTAQAQEITSLKQRVNKLEKKGGSRTHKLRRLYKVGRSARVVSSDEACLGDQEDASKQGRKIDDIDADVGVTLDSTHFDADTDMFGVHDLDGDEVVVESEVAAKKKDDEVNVVEEVVSAAEEAVNVATITEDEITLAHALAELKSVKPKVTTATTTTTKGILLQEPSESITTTTTIPSKDKGKGIMVEEPLNMKKKDQISFDEQEAIRLQAEFDEEIDADYQMAKQMQAEEQEELSIEEKSKLFIQLLEATKKHFAAKRAEEKRNRPPTSSKVRAEGSEQKVDEDKETAELQSLMEVIPDEEEVAVDAIPLATKPPSIVDWKILKEGKISYYQIIRADGSSKRYSAFIKMLRIFDREDLETL
ncbi:putative ribonuclease H-like domain-containing protein [Tanacetum coccineum]